MEPEKKSTPVSRQCDHDAYVSCMQRLISTCECAVANALDRNDQMDVIMAQTKLINVLKLVAPDIYLGK